ncbi:MAG: 30S ribosomal protein S20, partial [Myxococcota bacterium]|nr:30S ribosomal protein S20 [Myxococcota bacterium]
MANHKSALKRIRQTVKRRARNRHILTSMRTQLKRVRAAIEAGDLDAATSALGPATKAL